MSGLEIWSLWIGAVGMFLGLVYFGFLRVTKANSESASFYDKSILIVLVAMCAYIAMAFDQASFAVPGGERVLLPRYADWLITTPLLLIDLFLFARAILPSGYEWDLVMTVGFDVVMVVTGAIAALSGGAQRWTWFWISTAAFIVVGVRVYSLFARAGRMPDAAAGAKLRLLSAYLGGVWLIYPIAWALYFLGVYSAGVEDLIFMILDLTAKVGFGVVLLAGPVVDRLGHLPSIYESREPAPPTPARGPLGVS